MDALIDLRSDTVTRPTPAMRQAMANAEVGDNVLGDDPTVQRLEDRIAQVMGKEAGCFVPTGTMANQTAIRAQTEPGDEILAHEDSHIIHYETGAPAALSGCMIRPLRGPRGLIDADLVEAMVRPWSQHFPASRLLVVENTHNRGGGSVWPLEQVRRVTEVARRHGLRTHLDGARLWNACAATGIAPAKFAAQFDTVSCCFSKGLGAPAGSAVCGTKETIARVHRFRKMFGGTMRQSGILAAAALHALDHHRERLGEDHRNARRLAELLARVPGLVLDAGEVETNMVFFDLGPDVPVSAAQLCDRLMAAGVLALPTGPRRVRTVLHLDVSASMVEEAARRIAAAVARSPAPG
ncbi:MAG: aminotransferase class I/II-fold pyridoxal phosphate-dependent enzyme [Phycisphaerae bacterium]|nr:aminotransferase class I/II-fold pyridoxal phosphate-dependent enzyme [Phycisphaerae bacterium]